MFDWVFEPALRARAWLGGDPFARVTVDPDQQRDQLALPTADRTFCILFTPRSSSTRLTEILTRTRVLSHPGEFFNPHAIPGTAQKFNAPSLDAYLDVLPRVHNAHGTFGFEITYQQIVSVFGTEAAFHGAFGGAAFFWLIRRDIVAQAVSASRMVQQGLDHARGQPLTPQGDGARFRYRPWDIRRRVAQIHWMERRTEAFLARYRIDPVRLCYEDLVARAPIDTARIVADRLGVALDTDTPLSSRFEKLGTRRNDAFAERFRARHGAWLSRLDRVRVPMLAALHEPAD